MHSACRELCQMSVSAARVLAAKPAFLEELLAGMEEARQEAAAVGIVSVGAVAVAFNAARAGGAVAVADAGIVTGGAAAAGAATTGAGAAAAGAATTGAGAAAAGATTAGAGAATAGAGAASAGATTATAGFSAFLGPAVCTVVAIGGAIKVWRSMQEANTHKADIERTKYGMLRRLLLGKYQNQS